jgi:hypothetical protein
MRNRVKLMVDEEVENILAEIRERVRGQELRANAVANPALGNGVGEAPVATLASREAVEASAAETLAQIDSLLTVTARAWDRLPPLVSNRSGSSARFELWVKRHLKRATRWYAWEQVNFNAAVHHALRDILQTLSAYQQALGELRAETENQRRMLERSGIELSSQREELQAQREEIQTQRAEFKAQRAELETQFAGQLLTQRKEIDAQLSTIAQQIEGRLELIREEQHVCFKQLSLEAVETAVLEDRARRKAENLLEELRGRMDQLEKQS